MPALNDCPWLNQKKQGAPKSYGLLSFSLFTSYHCGMYDVPDFKTHPFAKNNHKRVRDETSPLQTLLKCLVANCSTAKEFSAKPLLTPLVNLGSKSDHSYDQMAGLQWLERSGAPQRARPWPQSEGPQVLNALTSWRSSPVPFFMYCSGTAPTHPEGLAIGYGMICVHAVLGPEVSRKSWL